MLNRIKSLINQTLVYGVGTIMTRLVTFMLLPVYTNVMEPGKYGIAALIFTFLAFMNHAYNYGLDSAFMRFYSHEKDDDKNKVLSTAVGMALISSLFFSAVVFFLGKPISELVLSDLSYYIFFRYAAIILFFDCIARVPFAYLRQEGKPMVFMGVRFMNVLTTLGLNIYLVGFLKMEISGIIYTNVVASIITALILYSIMFQKVKFIFSGEIAKKLLFFGLPFVPTGFATAAMEMLNRKILEKYLGFEEVGIFSAAYKLGIFMLLISTAFYYAWQPFFLREGNKEESRKLFGRVMTYFVMVTLGFWMILTLFIQNIANIHYGDIYLLGLKFQEGVKIVPFILLGYVFFGINQVLLPGIYFENKTRYLAVVAIIAAFVNVGLNFILIPIYGIMGPGYAMISGYIILVCLTYILSQKYFKVHYEYGRVLLLFVIFLTAGFGVYFTSPPFIIKVIIIILVPILLKIFKFFKKEEVDTLKRLIKR